MNIFVYSDESGVLDKVHNSFFVFGGMVFLGKEVRDDTQRKYLAAEKVIRERENKAGEEELKASGISNVSKGKLFRSLNQTEKFGIVVRESELNDGVFLSNKSKQRYLDWAFKIALKRKLESMIARGLVDPETVENIYVFVDEHATATNGRYELRESLEQEFRYGALHFEDNTFFPPLFPRIKSVDLKYCDSKTTTLVRGADIIANRLYYLTQQGEYASLLNHHYLVYRHPGNQILVSDD